MAVFRSPFKEEERRRGRRGVNEASGEGEAKHVTSVESLEDCSSRRETGGRRRPPWPVLQFDGSTAGRR